MQHMVWECRSGSQKHGSGRFCLGLGAFSRLDMWSGWWVLWRLVPLELLGLVVEVNPGGGGESSAHSTSVMCTTSLGSEMGRFSMVLEVGFFQWRAWVYSASF